MSKGTHRPIPSDIHRAQLGLLAGILSLVAWLAGGCPADRFLLVRVTGQLGDENGRPLAGQNVRVVRSSRCAYPSKYDSRPTDFTRYGDPYRTDANGILTFDAVNMEPVGAFALLVTDASGGLDIAIVEPPPDRTGQSGWPALHITIHPEPPRADAADKPPGT